MSTSTNHRERSLRLREIDIEIRKKGGLLDPDLEAEQAELIGTDTAECIDQADHYDALYAHLEEIMQEAKKYLAHYKERGDFYRHRASTLLHQSGYLDCGKCGKEKGNGCQCNKPVSKHFDRPVPGPWKYVTAIATKGRVEPLVPPADMPPEYRKEKVVYSMDTDLVRLALELNPETPPCTAAGMPIAKIVKEPCSVRVTQNESWQIESELKGALEVEK